MNFKDTDSSENPDLRKGECKDYPGFGFLEFLQKLKKL